MSLSMYTASVPALARALTNLRTILEKGAQHARELQLDDSVFTNFRLYPDMLPLAKQVHIATDMAKGCVARLAGEDPPKYADTETRFDELIERINRTLTFVKSFKPEQLDGSEEKPIQLKTPRGEMNFKGQDYLQFFVLPNVHFHCTTAYNILRHNGVALGKADYLGAR